MFCMEDWRRNEREQFVFTDLEGLVPQDHLLRRVEKVMDYEWLYERLSPYYCHDNGRPGTDPVVLIKMVLIQHLFGIPSLRQTQFCHGELCFLQSLPRRADRGDLRAHLAESGQQPHGRPQSGIY